MPATNWLPAAESFSIDDLMRESILWGVPKKRVTIEQRLKKRFGVPNYPQCAPILRPRKDLVICERCGDHHESYTICHSCYLEVKEVTDEIKKQIKSETNPLEPKEKEILVKFQNDDRSESNDYRIVEIERARPQWWAKNLLTKSTGTAKLTNNATDRKSVV